MKPLLLEASRDGTIALPSTVFDRNVAIALDRATQRMQEGQPVDIQDLLSRLLLDSISESSDSFRHILGRLSEDLPYPYYVPPKGTGEDGTTERLVSSLLQIRKAKLLRAADGDRWPLAEFWRDGLQQYSKVVNSSLAPFLSAIQGKILVLPCCSLSLLVANNRPKTRFRSVRGCIIWAKGKSFIAQLSWLGVHMICLQTASIICSVVYCLAEHPKILARLRGEVLDVIGSDIVRTPTPEDIQNIKFLRAVIDGTKGCNVHIIIFLTSSLETLRLYPPS